MACAWGTGSCLAFTHVEASTPLETPVWRYNRTVCTGLGDRLGAMLTVATLAYLSNVEIEMEWCTDPSVIYDDQRRFMPRWRGFNYSLPVFTAMFSTPANLRLVEKFPDQERPLVSYTGNELPANEALDQVYTLASRTTRLRVPVLSEDFIRAYHVVGSQLASRHPPVPPGAYVAVHMRAPDSNTYAYNWDPTLFCTNKLIQAVLRHGFALVVISNDLRWAKAVLTSHQVTFVNGTAFEDLSLLVNALAIIQHATPGYSTYSNVPSMARGIPLINTYKGKDHRYLLFQTHGDIPAEFYTCSQRGEFLKRLEHTRDTLVGLTR